MDAARQGCDKLAKVSEVTLQDLANEPLVSYHPTFTGRTKIDAAFAAKKLEPRMAIEAIDSDVIKTYVRAGLGVGIVAEMAVNAEAEKDLIVKPAGHLFGKNTARVAFKRSAYLRNFIFTFTELISARLTRDLVSKALAGYSDDFSL